MNPAVIQVENLSKKYVLSHNRGRGDGLKQVLEEVVRRPRKWLQERRERQHTQQEEFWALRNLNLEVRQGEVVGIIGRNGAGKSTLLKVLSRITEPTSGRIRIRGRVASLLEVGTGFHPELTGRENIYLNGAILGMHRAEIVAKFDDIVEFAEIAKFLDTPVKRYSSGMYVRLAFAVAAHLEPEILIVDEVLAVGDAAFQKKCIGKMGTVAREGRTVLFVSHNLGVVNKLCSRGVLLAQGQKVADGETSETITRYLDCTFQANGERRWENDGPRSPNVELRSVRIVSEGSPSGDVNISEPVEVQIEYRTLQPGLELSTSIHLLDSWGGDVLASVNFPSASLAPDPWACKPLPQGVFRATCTIPASFLNEGSYAINVVFIGRSHHIELFEREAIRFRAHDGGEMRGEWTGGWLGVVRPRLAWSTELMNA
jgi:lipopolysaccharide transport system ATP-binding protein